MLNAIKTNDPKLKASDKPIFDDALFDSAQTKTKEAKSFTLKDQIRKHVTKKMDKESDSEDGSDSDDSENGDRRRANKKGDGIFKKQGETLYDEEARIKREFKSKADENDDDDFLELKARGDDMMSDDSD